MEAYLSLCRKQTNHRLRVEEHFAQEIVAHLPAASLRPRCTGRVIKRNVTNMPVEYKGPGSARRRASFSVSASGLEGCAAAVQSGGYRGFNEGDASGVQIAAAHPHHAGPGLRLPPFAHAPAALNPTTNTWPCCAPATRRFSCRDAGRIAGLVLPLPRQNNQPDLFKSAIDKVMPALTNEPARLFLCWSRASFITSPQTTCAGGRKATARYAGTDMFWVAVP